MNCIQISLVAHSFSRAGLRAGQHHDLAVTPPRSKTDMSRKQGIRRTVTCIAVAAGLIAMEATAQNRDQYASPLSPAFYYLPTSCDIWENRENIGNYVGGLVEDYVKRKVVNGLISKVIGAVEASSDMLEVASLERTMPGMYDWMTNMYASIEEEAAVSVASWRTGSLKLQTGKPPTSMQWPPT
ncbi:MAG: hypothetical protein CSB44_02050 [Gammaproteobacteria bacterium]|nr:MAG: hypothetical protein CSB44_02050 [Gammaproteobacteria bacterium]